MKTVAYQKERASLMITELIADAMARHKVNRNDLAKRMGKTKKYVARLLKGSPNITVGMLTEVLYALNESLLMTTCPLTEGFEEFSRLQNKLTQKR